MKTKIKGIAAALALAEYIVSPTPIALAALAWALCDLALTIEADRWWPRM